MIKEAIGQVIKGEDLDYYSMKEVMNEMMDGTATQAQMGSFLTGLRMKGETVTEITACDCKQSIDCFDYFYLQPTH